MFGSYRLYPKLLCCLAMLLLASMQAQETPVATNGGKQSLVSGKDEEQPSNAAATLQKATQNPVANLISVPVQNNSNFGISPNDRTQNVLNIQPVIPMHLTKDWMLVARVIQPIVWQPYPGQPSGGEFGFGDMNPSLFLAPVKPGKLIWGAGPTIVIPTATSKFLGQGKLSFGPSLVGLVQPGHWTLGVLINNVWSVAGSGSRPDVNQMLLQYFVNYNMKKGWYLSMAPIVTANWDASSGNVWTVPVGGGVGRIMKLGFQPVNISAQFYGNAVHPSGASPWGMRLQIAFLFPTLSAKEKMFLMEQKLKELQQEQNTAHKQGGVR